VSRKPQPTRRTPRPPRCIVTDCLKPARVGFWTCSVHADHEPKPITDRPAVRGLALADSLSHVLDDRSQP
jgi:hypothetical protein